MPLHFRLRCRCKLLWQCTLLGVLGRLRKIQCRFLVLYEINVSDPVLVAPSGYNTCLRDGGLDLKIDLVPRFDIIGLVEVSFLVG